MGGGAGREEEGEGRGGEVATMAVRRPVGGGVVKRRGSHDGGAETCRRRCSEAERATDAAANPS